MTKLSSPVKLIKDSVEIYSKKENMIFFAKIYALLLPFNLFNLFQGLMLDGSGQPKNLWFTIIIVAANVLNFLIYILVSAAGIEAVGRVIEERKLSFKEVVNVGWKKYGVFFLLTILLGLVIGLGFVLLIVPGVLFLVWFSFSRFIIVENKIGIKSAFLKSKELVKGRFWPVFGRLIVFGLFSSVVGILVALIPYGVGIILGTFLGALFLVPYYLLYRELSV